MRFPTPSQVAVSRLQVVFDRLHSAPMSFDALVSWVREHQHNMAAANNSPSLQFAAAIAHVAPSDIPAYLNRCVDYETIQSGERDGRVHVSFAFNRGGICTLRAPDEPTEEDIAEQSAYWATVDGYESGRFDYAAFEKHFHQLQTQEVI